MSIDFNSENIWNYIHGEDDGEITVNGGGVFVVIVCKIMEVVLKVQRWNDCGRGGGDSTGGGKGLSNGGGDGGVEVEVVKW